MREQSSVPIIKYRIWLSSEGLSGSSQSLGSVFHPKADKQGG